MTSKYNIKTLAIIPARGGSKGIPKKNITLLSGKPLIAYTIESAFNSKYIDKIIVSTDSQEITRIAKTYGAEVILRPSILAGDEVPTEPVIEHVLNYLKKYDYVPDLVVLLQCTSPLRRKNDIDNSIDYLLDHDFDSVFSVFENKFFVWKQESNKLIPLNYDYLKRPRRQDKSKEYIESGSIYVFDRVTFEKEKNRICGKVGIYIMPYESSFEIDEPFDLWVCEKIINGWKSEQNKN